MSEILVPPSSPSAEVRQIAMFCHLATLIGLFVPFASLIGPLLVWQLKKDHDAFINDQGREAMNFQITVAIGMMVSFLLMFVVIGILMVFIVFVWWLVLSIIGGVKANEGVAYRYPLTLRLIK